MFRHNFFLTISVVSLRITSLDNSCHSLPCSTFRMGHFLITKSNWTSCRICWGLHLFHTMQKSQLFNVTPCGSVFSFGNIFSSDASLTISITYHISKQDWKPLCWNISTYYHWTFSLHIASARCFQSLSLFILFVFNLWEYLIKLNLELFLAHPHNYTMQSVSLDIFQPLTIGPVLHTSPLEVAYKG